MEAVDNFLQSSLFEDSLPEMITEPRKSQKFLRIKAEKGLPENLPEFRVIRSSRRKRSISALRQNGIIEIHIPDRMSRKDEIAVIPEMIEIVLRREAKTRSSDEVLTTMANELLKAKKTGGVGSDVETELVDRMRLLRERVESAITRGKQMEI